MQKQEQDVTKIMSITFLENLLRLWKSNTEEDEKRRASANFLYFLPEEFKWEFKPLAQKQLEKIKEKIETTEEKKLTKAFDKLAQQIYFTYDFKNVTQIPNYDFCLDFFLTSTMPKEIPPFASLVINTMTAELQI